LSLEECAAEARALNAANAINRDDPRRFVEGLIRPIFFTGAPVSSPAAVRGNLTNSRARDRSTSSVTSPALTT
jgi:hypothetical protein